MSNQMEAIGTNIVEVTDEDVEREAQAARLTHNEQETNAGFILTEVKQEQIKFHLLSDSPYNATIRDERRYAIKKALQFLSEIPRHIKLRVFSKTLLLLFYTSLFLYPLITLLVDRNDVLYNLVCIAIGGIGFGLQIYEFDQLLKDLKEIWTICKLPTCSCCTPGGSNNNNKTHKCKKVFCSCFKCCPRIIREITSFILNEILLYATLICTIMGFINEKTWELRNFWSYFDCVLLLYSIVMEVFLPRWYYLRWTWGAINTLLTQYIRARNMRKHVWGCNDMCTRYATPLRYTPVFIIMVIILQFSMLGSITVRIYADNFFARTNTTRNGTGYVDEVMRPEDGMYHVNRHTWYTIIGGIVVPFLSIVTYFIINQYWLWQPLHYTGQRASGFVPQNTMIGSMSDADKYIIFAFDPVAWVTMILLLASFIAFCFFASGNDYDGGSIYDGELPSWLYIVYVFNYIIMCFSFAGANMQTIIFAFFIYT